MARLTKKVKLSEMVSWVAVWYDLSKEDEPRGKDMTVLAFSKKAAKHEAKKRIAGKLGHPNFHIESVKELSCGAENVG